VQQGAVSTEFVHVVDLFATVVEFAGLQPPPTNFAYYDEDVEVDSDSVSLVPILEGTTAAVRDPVLDHILSERFAASFFYGGPSAAARNGTYKLICNDDSCSDHSFYNLIEDPLEEYPLETEAITCPVETTPDQDSLEENFCRLRTVILTESYFSR
jgi:arylsulfatase A-like enzyme